MLKLCGTPDPGAMYLTTLVTERGGNFRSKDDRRSNGLGLRRRPASI